MRCRSMRSLVSETLDKETVQSKEHPRSEGPRHFWSPARQGRVGVHANRIVLARHRRACPVRDGVRLVPRLLRFVTGRIKIGQ